MLLSTPTRLLMACSATFVALGAADVAGGRKAYIPSAVIYWNDVTLDAIRAVKPGPPMTARALAVVSTCVYDAWAAYDHKAVGTQFGGTLRRPSKEQKSEELKSKAIAFAAFRALSDLYPSQVSVFQAHMASLGYDHTDASTDPSTASGIGNLTANAVLAFRHNDGSNQLGTMTPSGIPYADYTGYAPANPAIVASLPTPLSAIVAPGRWSPLTFPNASGVLVTPGFIAPHWGQVTPFALSFGAEMRPVPPAPWNSAGMLTQIDELIRISANLDDRQKVIAEYWADGPSSELPPGHWNTFAQVVAERDRHGVDDDAKLFFALNNAMLDASISTWEAKEFYDYWRPITAIRYFKSGQTIMAWGGPGQGTKAIAGEAWLPFQKETFPTPPFAEYTSGHSTFSAAGAEVLKSFTRSDRFNHSATIKAHSLAAEPTAPAADLTLSWRTFTEAADEAGISRRYGGIHFREGDLNARDAGRKIGAKVFAKASLLWTGKKK